MRELSPGDEQGLGKEVDLYTKGWLPYTLRWRFRVVEQRWPHSLTLEAAGDFVGRGVWTLRQDGPWTDVRYEWDVRADKPLLRASRPSCAPSSPPTTAGRWPRGRSACAWSWPAGGPGRWRSGLACHSHRGRPLPGWAA